MLGYPGRNNYLREETPPVRCNRGMQQKTWKQRGLSYAGELAEQNFRDLLRILQWNHNHGITFYRCTSQSFVPWNSQYDIEELPNSETIRQIGHRCGEFLTENDMRLSFHPDYFVKPASSTEATRDKARRSLENHGTWLDLMNLPRTTAYPINIHIGGHYGDKSQTAERFRRFLATVSDGVSQRLIVENDDSPTLWSVTELVSQIYEPTGCPITFDYHHHSLSGSEISHEAAFDTAKTTWNQRPVTHYSEPAVLHDQTADRPQAHAAGVSRVPSWLQTQSDVMIECDNKESAVHKIQYASS